MIRVGPCGVLLVWPDHVEVRWIKHISEVSPRLEGESYRFNVPPEKQAWVEEQVRQMAPMANGGTWGIRVKQLGPERQQIQLEFWRDGFTGLVYEAHPDQIVPIYTRHAGVGASLIIVYANTFLWAAVWLAVWLAKRWKGRRETSPLDLYTSSAQ